MHHSYRCVIESAAMDNGTACPEVLLVSSPSSFIVVSTMHPEWGNAPSPPPTVAAPCRKRWKKRCGTERCKMARRSDAFQTSGNSPTHSGKIQPDFVVENHGSIFLLKPLTPSATSWIEEHIGQDNGYQPYFPTVVVEARCIADIVAGIQNDGLAVQP